MKSNGQVDNVEIIPDLENEMIEEMPQAQPMPQQPKGDCGCQKKKNAMRQPAPENKTNWMTIGLIIGGLVLVYFLFRKGKGGVEMPKVEVPEV